MPALVCPSGAAASGLWYAGRHVSYSHAQQAAVETDAERTRQFYRVCLDSSCEIPSSLPTAMSLGQGLTPSAPGTARLCISAVASNCYREAHTNNKMDRQKASKRWCDSSSRVFVSHRTTGRNSASFAQFNKTMEICLSGTWESLVPKERSRLYIKKTKPQH